MQDANAKASGRVKLDWTRLLGFDQAAERTGDAARVRLARVGSKVGTKVGGKPKQRA
jgi:hypothetical protein